MKRLVKSKLRACFLGPSYLSLRLLPSPTISTYGTGLKEKAKEATSALGPTPKSEARIPLVKAPHNNRFPMKCRFNLWDFKAGNKVSILSFSFHIAQL